MKHPFGSNANMTIPLRTGIQRVVFSLLASALALSFCLADDPPATSSASEELAGWKRQAVERAHTLRTIKWSPVADGIPIGKGFYEKGVEYTGLPYSSVKNLGRYIGFDIYVKTFLAAVENPDSVLYTRTLEGRTSNAEAFYGTVCSAYTSYAYQCGIWQMSWYHGPTHSKGVDLIDPDTAQDAQVGDIIFRPSAPNRGSHVQLVTKVFKDEDGTVTHVQVDESTRPLAKTTKFTAADFDEFLNTRGRELYRLNDWNAWRQDNRAESLRFPNYAEDTQTPTINRVLLLDLGDWVPYEQGEPVRFNILDKDDQGVEALVIKREEQLVERIPVTGKGVVERLLESCGNYTAYCEMSDGSRSQACEFSVCDVAFSLPSDGVPVNGSWDINFQSDNMDVVIIYFRCGEGRKRQRSLFVTDEDRKQGKITIPDDVIRETNEAEVWVIGENKYGRLKESTFFTAAQ